MGKARREAKLARRQDVVHLEQESKFSWKKSLLRMAKVAPRVLLMVSVLVVVQYGAVALKIPFLKESWGQIALFGVVYLALFRWIYADVLPSNSARKR